MFTLFNIVPTVVSLLKLLIIQYCICYRGLLYNGKNNMQAWGLIVLLLSKAAGHHNVSEMEEDKAAGVLHRYIFYFHI